MDTTFSHDGKVIIDLSGDTDAALMLIIQPDNKIVIAGDAFSEFALLRYNPDGSPDTTFDGDGKLITNFDGTILAAWRLSQIYCLIALFYP